MTLPIGAKEKPILLTAHEVQAVLAGRMTQFRRIVKPQPKPHTFDCASLDAAYPEKPWCWLAYWLDKNGEKLSSDESGKLHGGWPDCSDQFPCPYGKLGDRRWVREGVITHCSIPQVVGYTADGCERTEHWETHHRPQSMPRWASRFTLEITEVRVQRLQEISEEDAIAEGCTRDALSSWLRPSANKAKTDYVCWIRTEKGDSDETYCRDCGASKVAELIASGSDPKETILDGGWGGNEEDSQPFCEVCGVMLDCVLTDYAVGEELEHFKNYSAGVGPNADYQLLQMVDGCVAPEDQGALAKIGFRWLWEYINGPDSWNLNDWVWAISFKVVQL